jgi:excinuclease UvrABC nuclease subunit
MEETILKYQIALTKLKGIGPILAKNLLAYFGDVLKI